VDAKTILFACSDREDHAVPGRASSEDPGFECPDLSPSCYLHCEIHTRTY
jgi:hypothetical protein